MEYGGATLGGAMNFVTKNGYNASPLSVKMEAGSSTQIGRASCRERV